MMHYEQAEKLLRWLREPSRHGGPNDQVLLLEALTHAVLAAADAITLVPGAMP